MNDLLKEQYVSSYRKRLVRAIVGRVQQSMLKEDGHDISQLAEQEAHKEISRLKTLRDEAASSPALMQWLEAACTEYKGNSEYDCASMNARIHLFHCLKENIAGAELNATEVAQLVSGATPMRKSHSPHDIGVEYDHGRKV